MKKLKLRNKITDSGLPELIIRRGFHSGRNIARIYFTTTAIEYTGVQKGDKISIWMNKMDDYTLAVYPKDYEGEDILTLTGYPYRIKDGKKVYDETKIVVNSLSIARQFDIKTGDYSIGEPYFDKKYPKAVLFNIKLNY